MYDAKINSAILLDSAWNQDKVILSLSTEIWNSESALSNRLDSLSTGSKLSYSIGGFGFGNHFDGEQYFVEFGEKEVNFKQGI
ncbi:MAG: hypothetical protein IPK03_16530 [Bacteroidetes bacterium]|nr:hypothetical protein [Bacteroidota bacterium]